MSALQCWQSGLHFRWSINPKEETSTLWPAFGNVKTITQSHVRSEKAWLPPLKHTGRCYLISFMQCLHGRRDNVRHHHIKLASLQGGRSTDKVFGSKNGKTACREIFTHCFRKVSRSDTVKQLLSRDTVPDGISPRENKPFIPKPTSYGCGFILLHLLKMSAGGERGVEAHILGLGGIQLERIHKAGTRTKLLAVLVWLSNRTTHSWAK